MVRRFSSTTAPTPSTNRDVTAPLTSLRASLAAVVATLVLAGLLVAPRVVAITERMPAGTAKTVVSAVVTPIESTSAFVGLDRPYRWVQEVREPPLTPPTTSAVAAAPSSTTTTSTPPTTPPPPTAATTGPAFIGPTVPETTTTTLRPVTVASPLRVWAGGDSLGEYVGQELLSDFAPHDRVDVELDFHISTGLTRPDYFDWPQRLHDAASGGADIVIFMVGGNDNQTIVSNDTKAKFRTPEWEDLYAQRIGAMMDSAEGTELYWILLPPMGKDDQADVAAVLNRVVPELAESRPWVHVYDPRPVLTDDDGAFARYLLDGDGHRRQIRANDNVHITRVGSNWMAAELWALIAAGYDFEAVETTTTTSLPN